QGTGLAKVLGVRDLVSLGIAAIVGAGIFSTIGLASYEGGPAISLLFIFVAFACVFTALAYAQFAKKSHGLPRNWLVRYRPCDFFAFCVCRVRLCIYRSRLRTMWEGFAGTPSYLASPIEALRFLCSLFL